VPVLACGARRRDAVCVGSAGDRAGDGRSGRAGFEAQARQAFENLKTVLEAGGSGMDLVANTTVIVADAGSLGW
jgi:enamine deaminase RidA (YjgF/YER057c/UK114 family)